MRLFAGLTGFLTGIAFLIDAKTKHWQAHAPMSNKLTAKALQISDATFYRWKKAGLSDEEMREFARLGRKLSESMKKQS